MKEQGNMEIYIKVGKKLRSARLDKGMTLDDVGKRLGMTLKSVQRWETGEVKMTLAGIYEFCKVLDIDFNTLLREINGKTKPVNEIDINREARVLVNDIEELSPEDRAVILEVIKRLKK